MRSGVKILMLLFDICFILTTTVACGKSSSKLYWHDDPNGITQVSQDGQTYRLPVDTNDLTRLQKIVPFEILLPKYLPDSKNYYQFKMNFYQNILEPDVSITYYNLKNDKMIMLDEVQLDDYDLLIRSYPEYLEDQAKLNGGTVITLAGIKIYEREINSYILPRFYYHWIQGNLSFNIDIYGYDTNIARKIIESVIE